MTDAEGERISRKAVGDLGERIACSWLRAHGIKVLARNFKAAKGGEVDIVACDGKLLLFIEVKTRRADAKIRPLDAVDAKKRELIERGANAWLKKIGSRELPWRFDVMEILVENGEIPKVNHVRDAF